MNQRQDSQQLLNDSADKVIKLFKEIQKALKEYIFEMSRKFGITGPQLTLISILYRNPYITLNELSVNMGLSKSTVSGIVDRLVSHGIVIREIPKDNRRIVNLSISQEFLKKNDLIDLKNRFIIDILKNADETEIIEIITGLDKLNLLIKKSQNKNLDDTKNTTL